MKRKIFSLLVIFVLVISLTSCKKNKKVEISFSSNETSMLVGETKLITPDVTLGKKVKNFELTYSISDVTKASVDSDGNVTALQAGTVLLTATGNDKNETSASITIKIEAPAPSVYTISYTLNGGTNPAGATTEFTDCANALLPTPEREGYKFMGWYEGTTKVEAISENRNYSLSAKWDVETYTVKFVAEGTEVSSVTYTVTNKNITEPQVPAKDHYTGAWEAYTLTSGNVTVNAVYTPVTYTVTFVADGVTVEVINYTVENTTITEPQVPAKDYNTGAWEAYTLTSGNVTVNAVYTPVTYTVTFDAQGGSEVASATVNGGSAVAKPADPTKTGYEFKGWLLNGVTYDFATLVTENITLVASWEEEQVVTPTTYTVTFDVQGGTDVASQTIEEGQTATKPADPTKAGYTFAGWKLNGEAYDFAAVVTGDITLVATWTENTPEPVNTYTVTFIADGTTVEVVTYEENATSVTEPQVPAKQHYTGSWAAYTLNNTNIEVNAVYTANKYTITFKAEGVVVEAVEYTYGDASITEPQVPAKEHHTGAWPTYTLDGNKEVEAIYTQTVFTITFDVNGGTLANTTMTYEDYHEVTLPTPEKTGYLFKGWYEGTTKVESLTANKDVTLKAEWEEIPANTYTVTFKAEGAVVQVVTYEENATSVTEPQVPAKEHYTGAWAAYILNNTNIEVNAVYTANTYTVTFKANDTVVKEVEYTYGATEIEEPQVPAKEHHTGSWPTYTLDGDKEVVATYTANTYKVTFKANDTVVKEVEYTYGATEIEEPQVPAKEHYTGSWAAYTLDGDKEVVATYTAVKYTITLNAAEGTVTPTIIEVTAEDTLAEITLPTPERAGYEFLGWYDGENKVEAITELKNVELIAEWKLIPAEVTVTYNFNDGEVKPAYEFMIKNFNYNGANELTNGADNGISAAEKQGSYMNRFWTRILVKYNETVGLWESVGVGSTSSNSQDASGNTITDIAPFVIGTSASNTSDEIYNDVNRNMIIALHKLVSEGTKLYFDLGDLDTLEPTLNWNKQVKVYTEGVDLLIATGKDVKYTEEATILPVARKTGYDFVGWFDNAELTGDAVTKIEASATAKTINLYAKYTPTKYTITYELSGGTCSATLVEEYTIETDTITLPTASQMTIENGTFTGWLDQENNEVTEIAKGTYGNITLKAQWNMNVVFDLEVTDADAAALNALYTAKGNKAATIIVDPSQDSAGKFVLKNANLNAAYASVEYVYGTSLVATITAALEKAEDGAIIYVLAGTYSDSLIIAKANVVLAGPNYGIKYDGTRATEAIISNGIDVQADGFELNGFTFSGAGKRISNSVDVKDLAIKNNIITATGSGFSGGRTATIGSDKAVNGLVIENNSLTTTTSAGRNGFAFYGTLTNAVIKNNKITNGCTDVQNCEIIRAHNIAGTFEFSYNECLWATRSGSILLGNTTNTCTSITISNNTIDGTEAKGTAAIEVSKLASAAVLTISNNTIKNLNQDADLKSGSYVATGNVIVVTTSATDTQVLIKNNTFDANTVFNYSGPTATYEGNTYSGGVNSALDPKPSDYTA